MRIAIIGAGPAGASAAIRLARAGAFVMLFDPSHPREKPCGGGVTGRALGLVADAIDIATLPAVVVTSASVEPPTPRTPAAEVALVDRGLTPESSLVVLRRAVFDTALVDAAVSAGARLIPEKVLEITRQVRSFVIRTHQGERTADFLIGADGANSLVRKKLSQPFARSEVSVAAGYFVHGARTSAIAIKCLPEQPGYLWSFPRPDHLAVGVCAPASAHVSSSELRSQSLAWIEAHGLHHATRLEPYAWPIPSAGFSTVDRLQASGPGWLLLGDAAGLVDPLTREGIYYALLSGRWAAEALTATSGHAEAAYRERVRHEIYPEINRAARLSELFFSAAFSSLFVTALQQSGSIRRIFADLVAGTQPYLGLRRRLLATGEWRLAGRAVKMALIPPRPRLNARRSVVQ
jgi:geranylgeranyl reductase family protein